MADAFVCLRRSAIAIAVWNLLYCLIQMIIFGWQVKYVRDRKWELENRRILPDGSIGFQARFPGLYTIYSESPERRRINALFAIALTNLVLSFVHFLLTISLLIGSIMRRPNLVWPWLFSAIPIVVMSTIYSVIWWSGDVWGELLIMSVVEFVMSLTINGVCIVIIIFFFFRLKGWLTSVQTNSKSDNKMLFTTHGASWLRSDYNSNISDPRSFTARKAVLPRHSIDGRPRGFATKPRSFSKSVQPANSRLIASKNQYGARRVSRARPSYSSAYCIGSIYGRQSFPCRGVKLPHEMVHRHSYVPYYPLIRSDEHRSTSLK
ncbi:hypothetical protein AB6A40_004706 [Gnathostoma spinigerum]|uniref:Uncharacterized protein n=1 Tax=Gnathostoma spinigerum TaxID=75299 RepID=A0ABD6EFF4_9BILA